MAFPIRFFPQKLNIDFMRLRIAGFILSAILIASTAALLATKGLNLGIDFTGGILMEIRTAEKVELKKLRSTLSGNKFGEVSLQYFGDEQEILIRIQSEEGVEQAEIIKEVKDILTKELPAGVEFRKIDYVGPTVGKELIQSGYMSLGVAFIAVLLYIWFRFEWQFGIGAVVALLHDAFLTVGFYIISGFDFGLTSIAAILTIIGYSINDSVVIFDRIRENMRKYKKKSVNDIINMSINDTLSRTIITAGTTILAAGALVMFGGEVIKGFCAALLFGVVVGTYSSIYIAAPILVYFNQDSLANYEDI